MGEEKTRIRRHLYSTDWSVWMPTAIVPGGRESSEEGCDDPNATFPAFLLS